jgi:hypothetical protein
MTSSRNAGVSICVVAVRRLNENNIEATRPQGVQTMRFLSIYKTVERNTPPTSEEIARMGQLIEEGMKSGWLVSTEGCLPSA